MWNALVVNCFHFSVSLGYKTTPFFKNGPVDMLWIAFIFQYLWDTKQLIWCRNSFRISCELLSFFSIFGIQNNQFFYFVQIFAVVNCFHFSVSLGYKTTVLGFYAPANSLWIALATPNRLAFPLLDFIFQYLWDTKQPTFLKETIDLRCELLSFFSIFGIQNNAGIFTNRCCCVVNCFHFSVSLGYKTTF